MSDRQVFLLQRVQPAMTGLIDGSLSTLAPIFAVALATHKPHVAFFAGLPHYRIALVSAIVVVAFELLTLAWLRWRFFEVSFARALGTVTFAGVVIAAVSAGLGSAA